MKNTAISGSPKWRQAIFISQGSVEGPSLLGLSVSPRAATSVNRWWGEPGKNSANMWSEATEPSFAGNALTIIDLSDGATDNALEEASCTSLAFSSLFQAIEDMHRAPEGFTDHIDDETAHDAMHVLGYMESAGAPIPKLFSHGGDAVVFVWDLDLIRRYLTISGGDAAFLDVGKRGNVQCPYPIVSLDAPQAANLLKLTRPRYKALENAGE